ncbi:hypothetical protein IWW34DRAFT_134448 [Fusarium oxysporum f. sp. albedinis]|nr:hypothetical protein IWW34DRAFT_134448 [Fusarium oxysporum f. sp. albedinis]
MGRASPTTTVGRATSREVPLGGNEYRKRSSMYTAPIQEVLQMVRSRISTAAIVHSLAQHVLCSIRKFSLAPAVSVLLGQKIFTGQNGNKSSCGTSGTLTAAGRKGFRELTFLRDKCFQRH